MHRYLPAYLDLAVFCPIEFPLKNLVLCFARLWRCLKIGEKEDTFDCRLLKFFNRLLSVIRMNLYFDNVEFNAQGHLGATVAAKINIEIPVIESHDHLHLTKGPVRKMPSLPILIDMS